MKQYILTGSEEAVYEYTVNLEGSLSEDQRLALLKAADNCPVRRTLLSSFELREL